MTEFSPGTSLLGGALVGLSASLLWAFNGKVAGISGLVAGLVTPGATERGLRAFFAAGLLLGGGLLLALRPELLPAAPRPLWLQLLAGIAVGAGAHLGTPAAMAFAASRAGRAARWWPCSPSWRRACSPPP